MFRFSLRSVQICGKTQGKHTMLVLNNIKCKMVYRIFAVVQRKSNFVNLHKFAA